jgi:ABC-type lipoprotein export system ATPase subunit
LPIQVQDLKHSYNPRSGNFQLSMSGCINLHQGEFVSFMGPAGEGKATLLQMLAQVFFPENAASLFVPSHLQVLNVAQEPLFTRQSLFSNLTFGTFKGHKNKDGTPDHEENTAEIMSLIERVVKICKRLHIPEDLIALVKQGPDGFGMKGEVQDWGVSLSSTYKMTFTLIRALVNNPQVLVLHKPCDSFDESLGFEVLAVLQEFCKNKGVELTEDQHFRRPRTCLMTTNEIGMALKTDRIYLVDKKHGVVSIPKSLAQKFENDE